MKCWHWYAAVIFLITITAFIPDVSGRENWNQSAETEVGVPGAHKTIPVCGEGLGESNFNITSDMVKAAVALRLRKAGLNPIPCSDERVPGLHRGLFIYTIVKPSAYAVQVSFRRAIKDPLLPGFEFKTPWLQSNRIESGNTARDMLNSGRDMLNTLENLVDQFANEYLKQISRINNPGGKEYSANWESNPLSP